MFKLDLEKAEEAGIKLPISKKQGNSRKKINFCLIDYAKAFDCVDHHKLWKVLKEMGIPNHVTYLLRKLYAGQEATVRTGHGTTDWFQRKRSLSYLYIVYHIFFIHSSVNGHLDCFHALSVVHTAAMNTGVHVLFWIIVLFRYKEWNIAKNPPYDSEVPQFEND